MAFLSQRPTVQLHVNFELNESEVRALDALAGYGADDFLKVFYAHLGQAYMEPHEAGLRTLFEAVRTQLPAIMGRAKKAREAFNKTETE